MGGKERRKLLTEMGEIWNHHRAKYTIDSYKRVMGYRKGRGILKGSLAQRFGALEMEKCHLVALTANCLRSTSELIVGVFTTAYGVVHAPFPTQGLRLI